MLATDGAAQQVICVCTSKVYTLLLQSYGEHCCTVLVLKSNLWGLQGFSDGSDSKESACNMEDLGSIPGFEDFLEKEIATHSSIITWRIHGQRSLVGYSLWGHKGLDMTEWLTLTFKIFVLKSNLLDMGYIGHLPGSPETWILVPFWSILCLLW